MQICIFIFWKAMLQIASQHFPELNALNFFSVTVKDMGLPDSQREINLVIFHLNYILIHLNILPYSVLNWEYLKMSALGTTLMTVSLFEFYHTSTDWLPPDLGSGCGKSRNRLLTVLQPFFFCLFILYFYIALSRVFFQYVSCKLSYDISQF